MTCDMNSNIYVLQKLHATVMMTWGKHLTNKAQAEFQRQNHCSGDGSY